MQLQNFITKIQKLKIDRAHGIAPHKPILLLSILQAIENKLISENKIYITPELVALFKTNWTNLVTSKHECRFSLPFYHLTSEGFWMLKPKIGFENTLTLKSSMRSFNQLNLAVAFAYFTNEIFELISLKSNRDIIIQTILDNYFSVTKTKYTNSGGGYLNTIENNIVNESPEEYIAEIQALKQNLTAENFVEEIYIRGGAFKREIPKIYNNTCCISGMRIDATLNITMIDACHIIPFSESYNDTITNGIALCPNLHRAFDRGIISIDENYKVKVSKVFTENQTDYSIKQFENKIITLPKSVKHIPSIINLLWHNQYIFKH